MVLYKSVYRRAELMTGYTIVSPSPYIKICKHVYISIPF